MMLQLFINGKLFNQMTLPEIEFQTDQDCAFQDNVEARMERLEKYIDSFKSMMFRYLVKATDYEIYLVVESIMGKIERGNE